MPGASLSCPAKRQGPPEHCILATGRVGRQDSDPGQIAGMLCARALEPMPQYETILRGILADGVLGLPGDGKKTYQGVIQGIFTPVYQPEDAYISELVAG